jgi:hypothetical protein
MFMFPSHLSTEIMIFNLKLPFLELDIEVLLVALLNLSKVER